MIEQETEILDVDQINAALNDDPVLKRGAGAGKKSFIIPTAIFTVISIICCIVVWSLAFAARGEIIKQGGNVGEAFGKAIGLMLLVILMALATIVSLVFSIIGTVLSSVMIRSNKEYHYNMAYPIVMTAVNAVIIISYIVAWIVAFAA